MQVSYINNSINFNANLGPNLQQAIKNNYSGLKAFSRECRETKRIITSSAPDKNIIETLDDGSIFIVGQNTNWKRRFINVIANFSDFTTLIVDINKANEIAQNVQHYI